MMYSTLLVAASAAIVSATTSATVPTYNSTTGRFDCPASNPNGAFCAGDSLSTNIIIRCTNGVGQPGNCNDNLAGYFPLGVNYSPCWSSTPTSGDAACSKNCIVEGGSGNYNGTFTLPNCTPSATSSSSTASPTTSTPTVNGTTTITSTGTTTRTTEGTTITETFTTTYCPESTLSTVTLPATTPTTLTLPTIILSTATGGATGGSIPSNNGTATATGGSGSGGSGGSGSSATATPVGPSGTSTASPSTYTGTNAAPALAGNSFAGLAVVGLVAYFL